MVTAKTAHVLMPTLICPTICNDDSCYSQRSGYHIQLGVVFKDLRRLTGEDIYESLRLRLQRRRLHRRDRVRRGMLPEKIA